MDGEHAVGSPRGHGVILGWAGSSARQLRVIAAWYGSRGLAPIVVVPRVFRAMALPWGWSREGRDLAVRLVDHVERAPGPIIVHAFSNAGFWTYAAALRALERQPRGWLVLDRVRGLVLDSAPGFPERLEARGTARAATMAMMPMLLRALGRPPALSHPWLDSPLRAFMRFWYLVSPLQIRAAEASLETVRSTGDWPLLALYSSADSLVAAEHVESFIASASARGRRVDAVRWDDSEHVQHMLRHRSAYFDAVAALVTPISDPT